METRTSQPGDCLRVRELADPYASGELTPEARRNVADHAARCAACSRAVEGALRLRRATKSALAIGDPPPDLEDKIRLRLRAEPPVIARSPVWAMAAAAVFVAVFGVAWAIQFTGATGGQTVAQSASHPADEFLTIGLRHHVYCTEVVPPPATAVEPKRLEERLGPEYTGLVDVVRGHVPGAFTIVDAHRCSSDERDFVHVLIRRDGGLVSILVTSRNGATVSRDGVAEVFEAAGLDLYSLRDGAADVTGFSTKKYFVYVVAQGPAAGSADIASAIGPAVRGYLDSSGRG